MRDSGWDWRVVSSFCSDSVNVCLDSMSPGSAASLVLLASSCVSRVVSVESSFCLNSRVDILVALDSIRLCNSVNGMIGMNRALAFSEVP